MQLPLVAAAVPGFIVSILIQPEGRMQRPGADGHCGDGRHVSILIQPEGRMQPKWERLSARPGEFQSSSSQKAGCNTFAGRACLCFSAVSILIQPEGRMQPTRGWKQ